MIRNSLSSTSGLMNEVSKRRTQRLLGFLALAIVSTAYSTSTVLPPEDPEPIVVREVLDRPGFEFIRILGACDITADSVTCWDLEGKPLTSIAARIFDHYKAKEYPSLSIRPGVKNRWVLKERSKPAEGDFYLSYTQPAHYSGSIPDWRPGVTLDWQRLDAPFEDEYARLICTFRKNLPPVRLPLKKGATVNFYGAAISVLDFSQKTDKEVRESWKARLDSARYRFTIKRDSIYSERDWMLSPVPLDGTGKQIFRVDGNGKPITPGRGRLDSGFEVQIRLIADLPNQETYSTNLDPRHIAELQFSKSERQIVIFENLLLDPLPTASRG